MFLAFLTMSWLVYSGIHNPHNTGLECIHPNACNWLSSEAISWKMAVPMAEKAVQSVFLWAPFNSGALRSRGPVVENDKTEHKSTEKVAGEVPVPGGSRGGIQSRANYKLMPDLCQLKYPRSGYRLSPSLSQWHADYKIQTDCALEPLACDHSSSTALQKCFEIQLFLNRAFGRQYLAECQRVSSSSEGQRDKT